MKHRATIVIVAALSSIFTTAAFGMRAVNDAFAGIGYILVEYLGSPEPQRSTMNFTGSGVTVADVSSVTTVTIQSGNTFSDGGVAVITALTGAALEAVTVSSLTSGVPAYVTGMYERYMLDLANSCTVDHWSCLPTPSAGTTRWILDPGFAHPYWQTLASIYIDPSGGSDVTGIGTSGAPLKTYARLWAAWGKRRPYLNQQTQLLLVNDQPDLTDPVMLDYQLGPLGSLHVIGNTWTVLHSGTLTSGTHGRTIASNIPGVIEDTALGGGADAGAGGWLPYENTFLLDTTATTITPIIRNRGSNLATIGEPKGVMTAGAFQYLVDETVPAAFPASGDSYQVVIGKKIYVAGVNQQSTVAPSAQTGAVGSVASTGSLTNLWLQDPTGGDQGGGYASEVMGPTKLSASNFQILQSRLDIIGGLDLDAHQFFYISNSGFVNPTGPWGGSSLRVQGPWVTWRGSGQMAGGWFRNQALFSVPVSGSYAPGGHFDIGQLIGYGLVVADGTLGWQGGNPSYTGNIMLVSSGQFEPSIGGGSSNWNAETTWSDGVLCGSPCGTPWIWSMNSGTSMINFPTATQYANNPNGTFTPTTACTVSGATIANCSTSLTLANLNTNGTMGFVGFGGTGFAITTGTGF